eukprot:TRINITY_DN28_c0_g1_i1.p1 TRINITY_DN28_c0_g1~~TRINITY_DN28_c0_g1_i1.p1  ORF type:complete len:410 (-),score=107.47 TRINITY_DN28_c0_g1_i1:209-1438(-)
MSVHPDDFCQEALKMGIGKVLNDLCDKQKSSDVTSIGSAALNAFADAVSNYIQVIGENATKTANYCGRANPSFLDTMRAIEETHPKTESIETLASYYLDMRDNEPANVKVIPDFPLPKPGLIQQTELGHIFAVKSVTMKSKAKLPSFLPPLPPAHTLPTHPKPKTRENINMIRRNILPRSTLARIPQFSGARPEADIKEFRENIFLNPPRRKRRCLPVSARSTAFIPSRPYHPPPPTIQPTIKLNDENKISPNNTTSLKSESGVGNSKNSNNENDEETPMEITESNTHSVEVDMIDEDINLITKQSSSSSAAPAILPGNLPNSSPPFSQPPTTSRNTSSALNAAWPTLGGSRSGDVAHTDNKIVGFGERPVAIPPNGQAGSSTDPFAMDCTNVTSFTDSMSPQVPPPRQ